MFSFTLLFPRYDLHKPLITDTFDWQDMWKFAVRITCFDV